MLTEPWSVRVGPCDGRCLGGHLEGDLAEAVDGEADAVAGGGDLRADAAARHPEPPALEQAAAPVEEVREPRHGFEWMAEGVARLALARWLAVDPRASHRALQIDVSPGRHRRAAHHASVPGVLCPQSDPAD